MPPKPDTLPKRKGSGRRTRRQVGGARIPLRRNRASEEGVSHDALFVTLVFSGGLKNA